MVEGGAIRPVLHHWNRWNRARIRARCHARAPAVRPGTVRGRLAPRVSPRRFHLHPLVFRRSELPRQSIPRPGSSRSCRSGHAHHGGGAGALDGHDGLSVLAVVPLHASKLGRRASLSPEGWRPDRRRSAVKHPRVLPPSPLGHLATFVSGPRYLFGGSSSGWCPCQKWWYPSPACARLVRCCGGPLAAFRHGVKAGWRWRIPSTCCPTSACSSSATS